MKRGLKATKLLEIEADLNEKRYLKPHRMRRAFVT